jgi:PucR C-terminal helix-turn-helix domain
LFPPDETAFLERDALPAELRAALVPAIPTIVDAVITAIRGEARRGGPPGSALERNLRLGLTQAVERWFAAASPSADTDLHFGLGRAHARAGRSLDELMGFYRVAALTAWLRTSEVGAAEGIEPEYLYRLAGAGFSYVDELSTQAAAGFAEEHSLRSGATQSRRAELLRLLLRTPQPDRASLDAAAEAAGARLSPTLAFFAGPAELYDAFVRSSNEHFLLEPRGDDFVGAMLDPDTPGRLGRLMAAGERAGAQLALGPAVVVSQATRSLELATALLSLMRRGLVQGSALVRADEHDLALLLSAQPQLASDLVKRRLAPLEAIRGAKTRRNLCLTLRAWLRNPGQRKAIADSLAVHPQTVRYRMARLRELFGDALDNPDARFELDLALRLARYATPGGTDE